MTTTSEEKPLQIFKFCRICAKERPDLAKCTQTFECNGSKSTLKDIFNDCSPIKIIENDGLPDKFCMTCLGEMLKSYEFREKCRTSFSTLNKAFKGQTKKRKYVSSEQEPTSSKISKTDYENIIIKNEIICQESSEEDEYIYNKEEDDDEEDDEDYEEPVVKKKVALKLDKKTKQIVGSIKSSPKPGGGIEVKPPHPKDKTGTPGKSTHPDLGDFKITVLRGYKNSSHVVYEANGFLYVNTRNTAQRRYLRCSTSRNCPGKSCIDVKPDNEMEEYMYVYKLHNHPKETLQITKLKFLEEMRTIAASGNFTPRQLYSKAITKYPELYNIMPFATLSSRLYRLSICANPQVQNIHTIKQYAMHMMKVKPNVYCNTKSGERFFQEALIDEEADSCSIIYANTTLIESMSFSNEIFVDSSFKVNFERGMPIHFLTICISVNEHRFPIFFAIMDTINQYEYTKILTLFKDKYASSLHPEEIVTDFNASLFKALNEVYKHATLSGSLLHYIFDIYKQCNVVDIVKEIETAAEHMKMQSNIFSLPILPPDMIPLGLNHLVNEAKDTGIIEIFSPIFSYIENVWINKVTPPVVSVFCNIGSVCENIVVTFKKIRDIMSTNRKLGFFEFNEKLLLIDEWVSTSYQKILYGEKFARQPALAKYEKTLDRLWQPNYIEKSGFDHFFSTVLPLIEKLTSLIWVWGFYGYSGRNDEPIISPKDFFGNEYSSVNQTTEETVEVTEENGETILQYSDVIVEEEEEAVENEEDGEGATYEEIVEGVAENQQIIEMQQAEGEDGQVITLQFIDEPSELIAKNE